MMQLILFYIMPINYFSVEAILGYLAFVLLMVGFPFLVYLGFRGEEERRGQHLNAKVGNLE